MSNVKFNLSLFSSSISTLAAKAEDRPKLLAEQLSDAFSKASYDFLISGSALSNTLDGAMSVLACRGLKTSFALKARQILKTFESCEIFAAWGHISNGEFIRLEGFIGGNATAAFKAVKIDRDAEIKSRESACSLFGEFVSTKVLEQFTVKAKDETVRIDPLASFGAYSEKTIGVKLGMASIDELDKAMARLFDLHHMINEAYTKATETKTLEDDAAKAASLAQAKIDEAKNAEVQRVAAMQAELDAMRARYESLESAKSETKTKIVTPELLAA